LKVAWQPKRWQRLQRSALRLTPADPQVQPQRCSTAAQMGRPASVWNRPTIPPLVWLRMQLVLPAVLALVLELVLELVLVPMLVLWLVLVPALELVLVLVPVLVLVLVPALELVLVPLLQLSPGMMQRKPLGHLWIKSSCGRRYSQA